MKLFAQLKHNIKQWERNLRDSYNTDLSTPENRRRAHIYNQWFDHAVLRKRWTNMAEIAPGVFRGNQPTHERFEMLKANGLKSVLNLRGASASGHYYVEEESCSQLGLNLVNAYLYARQAASRTEILRVIDAFSTIERPFIMHCKSGADRAGFASAMYLLEVENRPVAEARKMMSVRFVHLKWTKTGILDYILDMYEDRIAKSPIGFRDWIASEYDGEEMQKAFVRDRKTLF
ncbi:MAG: tyrosine-protein phosphatase [Rhodobacterales bacterium]|nr:tyrosine-protein phosphatase [Rhodobacterales bacterium]